MTGSRRFDLSTLKQKDMRVTEGVTEAGLDVIKNKINPDDPIEEIIYAMNFRRITGARIDTAELGLYRVQVHQWELDRYLRLL